MEATSYRQLGTWPESDWRRRCARMLPVPTVRSRRAACLPPCRLNAGRRGQLVESGLERRWAQQHLARSPLPPRPSLAALADSRFAQVCPRADLLPSLLTDKQLLDTLVKNCGYPFQLQIATKEFLNELVRKFPERPPVFPPVVMSKILEVRRTSSSPSWKARRDLARLRLDQGGALRLGRGPRDRLLTLAPPPPLPSFNSSSTSGRTRSASRPSGRRTSSTSATCTGSCRTRVRARPLRPPPSRAGSQALTLPLPLRACSVLQAIVSARPGASRRSGRAKPRCVCSSASPVRVARG